MSSNLLQKFKDIYLKNDVPGGNMNLYTTIGVYYDLVFDFFDFFGFFDAVGFGGFDFYFESISPPYKHVL